MLRPGQHIHIVGVGGFGMSAIARVLLQQGYTVSGSDLRANDFTRALAHDGLTIFEGHDPAHISGADVIVISSAVPDDNPEVSAARANGLPVLRRRDLLGELMADRLGIAIAGTHGKTTTTALMIHTLIETGRDPTYIVGGVMRNTGLNAGVGQGEAFVIEADEYDRMFLGLRPKIAVVTNIEHDHPDCFPTMDDVLRAFGAFVDLLPDDDLLVACADDPAAAKLAQQRRADGKPAITYGLDDPQVDWNATKLQLDGSHGIAFVALRKNPVRGGWIYLNLAGRHNVLNALAVIAVADHLGIPFEKITAAFESFLGTERRSQVMGVAGGVTVINDYAHHPTAIRVTLDAYKNRSGAVWAVWQPHTYGRMRTLASDFANAFETADHVLVTDVYSVRENVSPGLDAAGLVNLIRATGHPDARYTGSLENTAQTLLDHIRPGDMVLILSAGDAPAIGKMVLARLRGGWGTFITADLYAPLVERFGDQLKRDESLARYTVARLGGPADALITVHSTRDLADAVTLAHQHAIPWIVLGGGANVLVGDAGYRGLVIVNDAKRIMFDDHIVVVESGAHLSRVALYSIRRGLTGLEWGVNVPGTVGGAIVNNAGAHGGDMAHIVDSVHVFSLVGEPHYMTWKAEQMGYDYRYSVLKGDRGRYVVLGARILLEAGHDPSALKAKANEFVAHRKRTQPPGASLGSMFKNPPGDYAGRLIEAAGLKGTAVGGVQISPVHANFFINLGGGTASDYRALIDLARETVLAKFGVELELEIECIGAW